MAGTTGNGGNGGSGAAGSGAGGTAAAGRGGSDGSGAAGAGAGGRGGAGGNTGTAGAGGPTGAAGRGGAGGRGGAAGSGAGGRGGAAGSSAGGRGGAAGSGAGGRGGGGGSGPCICPAIIKPVCGVNGVTYDNDCQAACVGVAVAYDGMCLNECQSNADCVHYADGVGDCCGACLPTTAKKPEMISCILPCQQPITCPCVARKCTATPVGGATR